MWITWSFVHNLFQFGGVINHRMKKYISMMKNNCCLAAKRNLEKKIQISTQKYHTPSKLQNRIKKIIAFLNLKKCFFLRKLTKISNLILSVSFSQIPNIFICVRIRQVAFLSEDWRKVLVWSSGLFSVLALELYKREHIGSRRDQTSLTFSTRFLF